MQSIANGLIGGALHRDIERSVDAQAAFVDGFGAVGGFEIFANLFKKIWREVVARILNVQAEWRFFRGGGFRRGNFSLFFHAIDDEVAAIQRALRIRKRRKFWTVDHSREQRRLLYLQISDRFAEIKLRSSGKTIVAVSEINLVRIHRKNLWFRIAALDLQAEKNFLHLAAKRAVAAIEKQISGQLHGDGARTGSDFMFQNIADGGASDARKID
ncbi:MAG TPA: hypothetical protein VK769_03140, partial [Verrucomicrobiae bacterium]|nr:hypothetical protein [Verrucomicrobiae bacterium]